MTHDSSVHENWTPVRVRCVVGVWPGGLNGLFMLLCYHCCSSRRACNNSSVVVVVAVVVVVVVVVAFVVVAAAAAAADTRPRAVCGGCLARNSKKVKRSIYDTLLTSL